MVVKSFDLLPNTENGQNRRSKSIKQKQKLSLALKGYSSPVSIYSRRKGRTEADWTLAETVCLLAEATPAEAPKGPGARDPLADMVKGSAWEPRLSGLVSSVTRTRAHELLSAAGQTCTVSSLAGHQRAS